MPNTPSAQTLDPQTWDDFCRAIDEFNSWHFYDCHETLEDIWRDAGGKSDDAGLAAFYHGIIKAAAGYHHILRNNHKGAVSLLSDTFRLLEPYRPCCLGVDVDRLIADLRDTVDRVEELGPDRITQFERSRIPTIHFDPEGAR